MPRLLTDDAFRERKLSLAKTQVVIDFWRKEVPAVQGDIALSNIVPYFTSKINGFTANDYIRPIVSQP